MPLGTQSNPPMRALLLQLRAHGIRASMLARALNLTPGAISRWLSGQRTPTARHQAAVEAILADLEQGNEQGGDS